jgi:serine/threonine protein kinase
LPKGEREPQGCLLEDEVLGLVQGQLTPSHASRVLEHLDGCAACQQVTNEALLQIGGEQQSSAGRGWLSNFAPGTLLAKRYRIRRYLARGGMGEVYEAHDCLLGDDVALKTVVATACDDRRAQQRLLAEAQLARRVAHPNVCRVYDVHQHTLEGGQSLQFLSMQLLTGQTLRRRMRGGLLPFDEVVSLARQLLAGLAAVHAAGVLHCDMKSDNVMLQAAADRPALVVITDFGLAQRLRSGSRGTLGRRRSGSPPYMAPEQLRGDAMGAYTDVYAFGVVLFEALTGELPFGTDGNALRARAWRREPGPRAPSQVRPGVAARLDELVLRCLAPDGKERYPSVEAASAALERCCAV